VQHLQLDRYLDEVNDDQAQEIVKDHYAFDFRDLADRSRERVTGTLIAAGRWGERGVPAGLRLVPCAAEVTESAHRFSRERDRLRDGKGATFLVRAGLLARLPTGSQPARRKQSAVNLEPIATYWSNRITGQHGIVDRATACCARSQLDGIKPPT